MPASDRRHDVCPYCGSDEVDIELQAAVVLEKGKVARVVAATRYLDKFPEYRDLQMVVCKRCGTVLRIFADRPRFEP